MKELPAKTEEAEAISKALKARGFKFVGPTMIYAMMQVRLTGAACLRCVVSGELAPSASGGGAHRRRRTCAAARGSCMQAAGMVNDHTVGCFRRQALIDMQRDKQWPPP